MTVYLAAPWTRRAEAREIAKALEAKHYVITRHWWDEEAEADDHKTLAMHARRDLNAVLGCDIFVLLNLEKSEGKAVETGVALTRHTMGSRAPRLIGCGPRYSNIFQQLPRWEWYETVPQLLEAL